MTGNEGQGRCLVVHFTLGVKGRVVYIGMALNTCLALNMIIYSPRVGAKVYYYKN